MTTKFLSKEQALQGRTWKLFDAEGQTLGRLATQIAAVLRGKHKPFYTPHVDCGDFVVVVNADKVRLTGNKVNQKKYYRHSGYVGGLKEKAVSEVLVEAPERVIQAAVKGMLPKGSLGRSLNRKLKVYAGAEHPHGAQNPEAM